MLGKPQQSPPPPPSLAASDKQTSLNACSRQGHYVCHAREKGNGTGMEGQTTHHEASAGRHKRKPGFLRAAQARAKQGRLPGVAAASVAAVVGPD